MGLFPNQIVKGGLLCIWMLFYTVFSMIAIHTIGQPIEHMNIGLLLVAGMFIGISFGMIIFCASWPTRFEFDEKARELGYVKENDHGKEEQAS